MKYVFQVNIIVDFYQFVVNGYVVVGYGLCFVLVYLEFGVKCVEIVVDMFLGDLMMFYFEVLVMLFLFGIVMSYMKIIVFLYQNDIKLWLFNIFSLNVEGILIEYV